MTILQSTFLSAAIATSGHFALAQGHADQMDGVSTYRETALFNEVVGDTRFVGAFETGPNRCDVIVFQAAASDRLLNGPMRRMDLPIPAGARGLLGAGPDSALAIACASDAAAIRIAPQSGH
jgi:hypothetical protein